MELFYSSVFLSERDTKPKRFYKKDDMREFLRLMKMLFYNSPAPKKRNNFFPSHSFGGRAFAPDRRQNCVVKFHYGVGKEKNVRFLREYLVQKHKPAVEDKPVPFSSSGFLDREELLDYCKNCSDTFYKIILSPGRHDMPLDVVTRSFMARLTEATGRKYRWVAAVHRDTAVPHVHILIDGRDMDGRSIGRFPRDVVCRQAREMARDICTFLKGERSDSEMELEKANAFRSFRYVKGLDSSIESDEHTAGLTEKEEIRFGSWIATTSDVLLRRLDMLVSMGLAKKTEKKYLLERNWAEKLRAVGRYNTFLEAREKLRAAAGCNMELFGRGSAPAQGIIRYIYRMDDESVWNYAYVVENPADGRSWYIPVYSEPSRALLGAEVTVENLSGGSGLLRPKLTVMKWPERKGRGMGSEPAAGETHR
jgi:hypothetical protein